MIEVIIRRLLANGATIRQIAAAIDRAPSTTLRRIARLRPAPLRRDDVVEWRAFGRVARGVVVGQRAATTIDVRFATRTLALPIDQVFFIESPCAFR